MLLFLQFLLVCFLQRPLQAAGCQSDMNADHRSRVSCVHQGLTGPPASVPSLTQVLVLSGNSFTSLSWAAFSRFPELHELDLSHNHISTLEPPGPVLENLSVLRLTGNRLTGLGGQVFRGAPNLMEIHLDSNQIRSLHDASFSDLPRLEVINLSRNKLPALPPRLLERVSSSALKTFDLENNSVSLMPDNFFSSKPELPYVYLTLNPWLCSCAVGYLHSFLNDQEHNIYRHDGPNDIVPGAESVVCSGPPHLRNRVIMELEENDFCPADPTFHPRPHGDWDPHLPTYISVGQMSTPQMLNAPPTTPTGGWRPAPTSPALAQLTETWIRTDPDTLPTPTSDTPTAGNIRSQTFPSNTFTTQTQSKPPTTKSRPTTVQTELQTPQLTIHPLNTQSTSRPDPHTLPSTRGPAPTSPSNVQLNESRTRMWISIWNITEVFWHQTTVPETLTEPASYTPTGGNIRPQTFTTQTQYKPTSLGGPGLTLTTIRTKLPTIEPTTHGLHPQSPSRPDPHSSRPELPSEPPTGVALSETGPPEAGGMLLWCWWLFCGFVLVCVLSALASCVLCLWLLRIYLLVNRRLRRPAADAVVLRAFSTGHTHTHRESEGRSVGFLSLQRIPDVQAVFRSVLFIEQRQEPHRMSISIPGLERRKKEVELESVADEADKACEAMASGEVFRKTLCRVISAEEEAGAWREEEERDQTRFSLILRENRGHQPSMQWLIGEWQLGEGAGPARHPAL